jgi:hypothetical protein
MKFHHQRKQVSTCIILVLKEVKCLAFLALQRNSFMYVLPWDYQLQWISFWLNQFIRKNWTKTLKSVIMNDTGPTVCTCDTLVPTRILNSEISWFCFDFPKWGPVSFIITDFNVFVQFFRINWLSQNEIHCNTGPHLGKSKQNQEISEFKILVGTNVSHVQTV